MGCHSSRHGDSDSDDERAITFAPQSTAVLPNRDDSTYGSSCCSHSDGHNYQDGNSDADADAITPQRNQPSSQVPSRLPPAPKHEYKSPCCGGHNHGESSSSSNQSKSQHESDHRCADHAFGFDGKRDGPVPAPVQATSSSNANSGNTASGGNESKNGGLSLPDDGKGEDDFGSENFC